MFTPRVRELVPAPLMVAGRRRPDGLVMAVARPGDFWREAAPAYAVRTWWWAACDPRGALLSLRYFEVREHADGLISVREDIVDDMAGWRGRLAHGTWTTL